MTNVGNLHIIKSSSRRKDDDEDSSNFAKVAASRRWWKSGMSRRFAKITFELQISKQKE